MFPLKCLIRNDFVYFDICLVVEYFQIVILYISRVCMCGMGTVNKIIGGDVDCPGFIQEDKLPDISMVSISTLI